jgi:cell wall-associated NlpC family hydrolase
MEGQESQSSNDSFKPGDILEFSLENELHWGVYIGYDKIIHAVKDEEYEFHIVKSSKLSDVSFPRLSKHKVLSKRARGRDDIVVQAILSYDRYTTRRDSLQFVEYCYHDSSYSYILKWVGVVIALVIYTIAISTTSEHTASLIHSIVSGTLFGLFIVCLSISFIAYHLCGPIPEEDETKDERATTDDIAYEELR